MRQAAIDDDGNPGITTAEAAEISELRRRAKLLRQDNSR